MSPVVVASVPRLSWGVTKASGHDLKLRMLEFGVADETAWQVGLSCGGRIRVLVERVS
jgi:xanthine/CO dehydrogenase XdhC/CoxF family maturation factor